MSRRPISMGIQQPSSVGGPPPPAMYDTSVSSYAGDSGASSSWNTPSRSGSSGGRLQQSPMRQQQPQPSPQQQQQQQQQQHYSYFPKSHPNNGGGPYHQQQQPSSSPVRKQSQYTMMATNSYVPKSPRSDIGPYNNNYRQSYHGQQMAQQQHPNPAMVHKQHNHQQSYQPNSPAATATTATTSTGGASHTGGYRTDYYNARSPQHGGGNHNNNSDGNSSVGTPGRAMTEPISTDRDRFSPHINRFSSQQQQQQQQQAHDNYRRSTTPQPQYSAQPPTSPGGPRSGRLAKVKEAQQHFNRQSSFRRQVSAASSSATVASSHSSTFARSQQAQQHPEQMKHHHHEQQQQQQQHESYRASPPLSSYPDPDPSMEPIDADAHTTSSASTRRTRHTQHFNVPPQQQQQGQYANNNNSYGAAPRAQQQQHQQQASRGRSPGRHANDASIEMASSSGGGGSQTPTRGRSPSQRTASVDPSSRFTPTRSRSRSAVSQFSRGSATGAASAALAAASSSRSQSPSRNRSISSSNINNNHNHESQQLSAAPPPTTTEESPAVPAVSPGANRTRYLAERFEQRMRSRGRSYQLNSAMNAAYNSQQQQQQQQHATQITQDEKKEPDEPQYVMGEEYVIGNEPPIETPDATTVKELRHRLWDDKESLQVRVPPNTTVEYDQALQQQQLESYGSQNSTPPRGRDFQPNPADARNTRSLSPRAARRAQESAVRGAQELDIGSNSGSTSSAARRFNSKFYEAAALTNPEYSGSGSAGGGSGDPGTLGAAPNPFHQHSLHSTNKNSWMNNGDRGEDFVATTSQATTPKINNSGEHISALLQKLHSVNRGDPSRALMEIDEILKQEALKDDPTYQRALRVPDTEHYMKYRAHQDGIPVRSHEDDDESDGETTVSSITNPTYQGMKKLDETMDGEDGHEQAKEEIKTPGSPGAGAVDVLGANADANAETVDHVEKSSERAQPQELTVGSLNRTFKPIQSDSTNPTHSSTSKEPSNSDKGIASSAERMGHRPGEADAPDEPKSPQGYADMSDGHADDLALKIRRWDALTGKETAVTQKQGLSANKDLLSPVSARVSHADESEGLGSILTPPSKNREHPWDGTANASFSAREASTEKDSGVEGGVSAFPSSDNVVGKRGTPTKLLNISNDLSNSFDDAWVALPTSRFFPSSPNGSSQQNQKGRTGSPSREEKGDAPKNSVSEPKRSPSRDRKRGEQEKETKNDERVNSRDRSRERMSATRAASRERTRAPSREPSRERKSMSEEKPKPKRRLRALLQRGRSEKNTSQNGASASVSTSIVGGGNRTSGVVQEEEAPPPRGRRHMKASESRSRSLEERRVRNPNIARKFSRMLRVYGDE